MQKQAASILIRHPAYQTWEHDFSEAGGTDFGLYIFMRASTWPDEIRRRGSPYDHPQWHYVDYPLRPPKFEMELGPDPDDDILFGIAQSEKALGDTNAAPVLRAVYLSWLIHLIGDLHQPLHCSSLFTEAYPNGDKGGNLLFVRPAERAIRLHSLWDGLLGTSGGSRSDLNYAIELQSRIPTNSLPNLVKFKTAKEWSLESRDIAVEIAYLHGDLKGGTNLDSAETLPEGYTKTAKMVSEKQAVLAGYRLAQEIEKSLGRGNIMNSDATKPPRAD